jgi:hypothetical protein|tara:strand:+ start:168 stop:620 length:453 start_codon:yes stop_codon:yes gene_type:complete
MPIGNLLSGLDQQYVALKDEAGTWRILNTWSEDLKSLDAEDEIPDDNAAVTLLSEGQFIALIKEAGRLGVLANATASSMPTIGFEEDLANQDKEIENLKQQLAKAQEEKLLILRETPRSEDYNLKERAMESILKLAAMSDMAKLTITKDE